MCGWTIYRHPLDFPDHYVVRQWWVLEGGVLVAKLVGIVCHSLEEAREQIPPSAICIPREDADDAVIVETYL